jgi:hypothetical protein
MVEQLITVKRIFAIAEHYSQQADPLSAGLAVSLFQDAVEQLSWCVAKHLDLDVKDSEVFTSLIAKIESRTGAAVPYKAKIYELNKARIGFKHYGNLPAHSESEKFRAYTYDFLVLGSQRYLNIDFESISLVSLIRDSEIRRHLEVAQTALLSGDVNTAISEVTYGRFYLFKKLEAYFPRIDTQLREADQVIDNISGGSGFNAFRYLTEYFREVARFNIAVLAGGDVGEHLYLENALPRVIRFQSGSVKVIFKGGENPTNRLAERAIKYVIETTIRIESKE